MSASILFDNILITNSIEVANDYAANSFDLKRRKIEADAVRIFIVHFSTRGTILQLLGSKRRPLRNYMSV